MILPLLPLLLLAPQGDPWELLHTQMGSSFAIAPQAAASLGDIDGDLRPELLIASPGSWSTPDLLHLFSSENGEVLWLRRGDRTGFELGGPLLAVPDLDGDGVMEMVTAGLKRRGGVHLRSGATGQLIWRTLGLSNSGALGSSLAVLADLNGDGHAEILAGAPGAILSTGAETGEALLLSGIDGSILRIHQGSTALERLGASVAAIGDVDLDGVGDYLIASVPAPASTAPGQLRLYSGATGNLIRSWSGAPGEDFGFAVLGLPDLDGDGVPDLAVGAPGASPGGRLAAGSVFRYSGASGSSLGRFDGHQPGMRLGQTLARAGDLDRDGWMDLACGAPRADGLELGSGQVQIRSGSTGALLRTIPGEFRYAGYGSGLCQLGDFDRDGYPDLGIFGDGSLELGLSVHSGRDGRLIHKVREESWSDVLGESLAAAGDLDRDSVPDYWIGSPDAFHRRGKIQARSGKDHRLILEILGTAQATGFGRPLAGQHDFNADGVPDLVVGAPTADPLPPLADGSGTVYLYSGATGRQIRRIVPEVAVDFYGSAFAVLPDIDSDGVDDIVVGARDLVSVVSGATGIEIFRYTGATGSGFGGSIAALGDWNGDGIEDFAVGAGGAVNPWTGRQVGAVYVMSGSDLTEIRVIYGPGPHYGSFGESLAAIDDLDQDGLRDLLVSDSGYRDPSAADYGAVLAVSSATDGILWLKTGIWDVSGSSSGLALAVAGDVDGDGIPDALVGNRTWSVPKPYCGKLAVLSGADGELLHTILGTSQREYLGTGFTGIGDLDGDGLAEILVSAPWAEVQSVPDVGRVELWSFRNDRPYLAPVPLLAGQRAELRVLGAQGPKVGYALSLTGPGPSWIPRLGLALDLSRPLHTLGWALADPRGQAVLGGVPPLAWLGRTVWLQAVDLVPGDPQATNSLVRLVR